MQLMMLDKFDIHLGAMRERYQQTKAVQEQYNKGCILWRWKEKWKGDNKDGDVTLGNALASMRMGACPQGVRDAKWH